MRSTHVMPSIFRSLAVCAVSFAAVANAQTPPVYRAEFLGPVIGVSALNSTGRMVGTTSSFGGLHGWTAGPGSPPAPLPLPPGRVSSYAIDVNDSGTIAGAVSSSISPEFGGVATIWILGPGGTYTPVELGMLPGSVRSVATALNNVGDVVGFSADSMYRYPVWFTSPSGIADLRSTGLFDPQAINDQRVLVDASFTIKRMDLDTMIVEDLGVPQGQPSNYVATRAAAINEHNQVAGQAILATSTSCDRQAARYTDGVGWQIFSSCGTGNGAYDINNQGDVVMRLNVDSYVRFEGLGSFRIEDLIAAPVGHWYVQNGYGLAINDEQRIALTAVNTTTGENGVILLTRATMVGTPICFGDGSSVACPCGNTSAPGAGEGCVNSTGLGARLIATGSAGVAQNDLVLQVSRGPAGKPALFLQGASTQPTPFFDGIICAAGPIRRLQVCTLSSGGSAQTSIPIATAGAVNAGDVRMYQTWYRDAQSLCGTRSNLSSGLEIVWLP